MGFIFEAAPCAPYNNKQCKFIAIEMAKENKMIEKDELLIKAKERYKRKINRWKRKIERTLKHTSGREEIIINCGRLPTVVVAFLLEELNNAGWDARHDSSHSNDALIIYPRFVPKEKE